MKKASHIYLSPDKHVDLRVKDLLERMTIEEKVKETGFLMGDSLLENNKYSLKLAEKQFGNMGIGGIMDPYQGGCETAKTVNSIQRYLINKTRLGIPALIMSECLHGHLSPGATVFPQAIGLSCSWDRSLIKKVAATIATEASCVGIRQTLGPDLDLARDPRWGRVEETYGEDTYLVTQLGIAYIKGMQGKKGKLAKNKLVTTIKHFAGHCDPQGGINIAPTDIGERKLREEYLPSFKAAIDAGALSVMPAYNEVDGIPCTISKFLLQEILHEEWDFNGYTFSDFGAIDMLAEHTHMVAESLDEAGRMAFDAGIDMEAPVIKCFGDNLLQQIKEEKISIERLDAAVSSILRVKFLAGLFETPYVDENKPTEIINCDKHVKLARTVAAESIVLLKNEEKLLPLKKSISSIAVIGPNADIAECGDYCLPKSENVSPLEGIRAAVSSDTIINSAYGCDIHNLNQDGFSEAIQAARNSDVAIMFMGGASMSINGVGWVIDGKPTRPSSCGEGHDRTDLNLPGSQQLLVEAIVSTGTPVIVVLINGRPLSISWIAEHVPAIVEAWYPGEQGGHAIADILFGKTNPSGKLTMTIPRSVGQVPKYYSQKPSARGYYKQPGTPEKPGRDYVYMEPSPLYEFGYGLSYTSFKYSKLSVTPNIEAGQNVKVSINIRNTGKIAGKEIVQLYINDVISSVTTPIKLLKQFKKTNLKPGEMKTVQFMLNYDDLSFIGRDMKPVVEPGIFEVMIGPLKKQFQLK
jgi:beta-glucosidase